MQAQDIFYVDPASGDNGNSGTEQYPWADLNPAEWTNGCTLKLKGALLISSPLTISYDITIEGINDDAALMGCSDDDFAAFSGTSDVMFQVSGGWTLTAKNITLKNWKRTGDGDGGMILNNGILNFDNVVISKAQCTASAKGGAIFSNGAFTLNNTEFNECIATQGGAVFINWWGGTNKGVFEGCKFIENSTDIGSTVDYPGGGAIWMQGTAINVSFDGCLFDSNKCTNANSKSNARGGAIKVQGFGGEFEFLTFTMKNSTAMNNESLTGGGFLVMEHNQPGTYDFNFINNVFYKNKASAGDEHANGQCMMFGGGNEGTGIEGSFVFINNTSLMNNDPNNTGYDQNSYFIEGFGNSFKYIMVNNLLVDRYVDENTTAGYGLVVSENPNYLSDDYTISNNILDGFGGWYETSWSDAFLCYFRDCNDGTNVESSMASVGLDDKLTTPATGVPYIELLSAGSLAVDKGLNSLIVGSDEMIPESDIRGVAIYNGTKDIGAYEYNDFGSGINNSLSSGAFAYPNPFTDYLFLPDDFASVKIYNVSGICCLSANDVQSIDVSLLPAGVYVLKAINKNGKTFVQTVLK